MFVAQVLSRLVENTWHSESRLSAARHAVNLLHNPFGPLHSSRNHLVGSRTSLRPAKQVISPFQIAGHDDPGNDGNDPLAPFVHLGIVHLSLCIRQGFEVALSAQSGINALIVQSCSRASLTVPALQGKLPSHSVSRDCDSRWGLALCKFTPIYLVPPTKVSWRFVP
jgi:hypothetical protein